MSEPRTIEVRLAMREERSLTILRFRDTLCAIARALRAIAGVPDYDRYLAHMRRRHPDTAPLSPIELFAARQRERFERPGGRCC